MFKKIVATELVNLTADAEKELRLYTEEVCMYHNIPGGDQGVIRRIRDGDEVLVSYTSKVNACVIESYPSIRYIGMCCSLYFRESANVDVTCARRSGVTVLGIRNYSNRGVVEFAINGLVRFLHGYDRSLLRDISIEVMGLEVGTVGIGVSGGMIADAMRFMGANVSYYSHTKKAERESQGMTYRPLKEPLEYSETVFVCLNKDMIFLHKEEFKQLGTGELLFSTSIGPTFDIPALGEWLDQEGDYFIYDTKGALGDPAGELLKHPHVVCTHGSASKTRQAFDLLSKKVLDNLWTSLGAQVRLPQRDVKSQYSRLLQVFSRQAQNCSISSGVRLFQICLPIESGA